MHWSLREGYAWVEDKEHCEEHGRMLSADPSNCAPALGAVDLAAEYQNPHQVQERAEHGVDRVATQQTIVDAAHREHDDHTDPEEDRLTVQVVGP